MNVPCPQPETLRSYLSGKSTDLETEIFELHLASCVQCQVNLETLSEESDSIARLVTSTAKAAQMAGIVGGNSRAPVSSYVPREQKESSVSENAAFVDENNMIRDYRILERIGQGGMGSVYRVYDHRLKRYVAMKILKSERMGTPEAVSRFAREMELLARLKHDQIVQVFEGGEQNGVPYFVMELVSGVNLSQLVKRLGPLPVPEACSIVQLAASALQYAHDQKVIHRDIKPSNLMITVKGDVQLLDLGLAQILEMEKDDVVSRADQVLGTLAYMSPEQRTGRQLVTPQSDIFSLGITLYELLTGHRPSDIPPVVSDIRTLRPDVDNELNALVRDMISLNPSERPRSMAEVESRLSGISTAKNLVNLVAEYYRWDNRTLPQSKLELTKVDTDAKSAKLADRKLSAMRSHGRWIGGLATVGVIAALVGYFSYPERTFRVEVVADQEVASALLTTGSVVLKNVDTGKRHAVIENAKLYLTPGKYRPEYNGPDEFIHEGNDFEVFDGPNNKLILQPRFAKQFQYPDIPDRGSATYQGSLWRFGWDEKTKFTFKIYLEVLAIEANPDSPVTKWLQVDVYSLDGEDDYRESAVLNVDAKEWANGKVLAVYKGWIVAKSPKIADFMKSSGSDQNIVVDFSLEYDLLAENHSILLPKRRLSVQDVLSLFFGQDVPAASKPINAARAGLPDFGEKNSWIEPIFDASTSVPSLVISSRKRNEDKNINGWMMARRRNGPSNPFGFLKLEVKAKELRANCVIMNFGEGEPDVERTKRRIEALERKALNLSRPIATTEGTIPEATPPVDPKPPVLKLPPSNKPPRPDLTGLNKSIADMAFNFGMYLGNPANGKRMWQSNDWESPPILHPNPPPTQPTPPTDRWFDRAVVPKERAIQVYQGSISLGNEHTDIHATIKSLGEERIENRVYRWIEADVTTLRGNGPGNREAARVLIDAAVYDDAGNFVIKRGWIAYENMDVIFELPVDGTLESLVDLRLPFQRKVELNRIGVSDVLSMLFNADLKPRNAISGLRAKFAGALTGLNRGLGTPTDFKHLKCFKYESPIKIPNLHYSFLRSTEVPFGFVTATLTVESVKINLEMESFRLLEPNDLPPSIFGTSEALIKSQAIAKDLLRAFPNWRIWKWSHAGKTYKAWAEFGGTIDSPTGVDVLLRDKSEAEIRVPTKLLSDEDKKTLLKGRLWEKESIGVTTLPLWRILTNDDPKSGSLEFTIPNSPVKSARSNISNFSSVDKQWIEKRRAAAQRKSDSLKTPEAWQDFAGFVR